MDRGQYFHQGNLEHLVRKLFPGQKVESNSRKKSEIKNPTTGHYLEIDVWVPGLQICFEFQDLYHYISTWDHQMPLLEIQTKDGLKNEAVVERGDTLVVVPVWWDGSERSLISAIQFVRPELLSHTSGNSQYLISLNPPESLFKYGHVPDVGRLMLASFPQVNSVFVDSVSPEDPWWLGEKYDGIRSCWNPTNKEFYSRWGIGQQVSEEFAVHFPELFLDGEIWFGRGSFIDSVKLMGFDPAIVDWPNFRFVAFDNPHPSNFGTPFEQRYQVMLQHISPINASFLTNATRVLCSTPQQLYQATQDIIGGRGEGVILRKPLSFYLSGRSSVLIKMKVTRGDMEALVADVLDLHSAKLQLPDGGTFEMDLPPEFSNGKLKRGDVVTLAYESYTMRGAPKNPKIHRIRSDVTWEQIVVENSMKSSTTQQSIIETTKRMPGTSWHLGKSDARAFFEKVATRLKFDPLIADNWHSIHELDVKRQSGSKEILDAHNGHVSAALMAAFPEIGLVEDSFKYRERRKWVDPANRRKCFIGLAQARGFDPLVPSNWYPLNSHSFDRVFNMISFYYKGSYIHALFHLFPEIGLEKEKFSVLHNKYWADIGNRRAAFDAFAKKKQFDPLSPANWYKLPREVFNGLKRKGSILYYYKGRLAEALVHLYPEIGLSRYRFSFVQRSYWNKKSHRRLGLEEFARDSKFDPLVPDNWYRVQPSDAKKTASMRCILGYHNDSLRQAVMDLFPDIGLDTRKFFVKRIAVN